MQIRIKANVMNKNNMVQNKGNGVGNIDKELLASSCYLPSARAFGQ